MVFDGKKLKEKFEQYREERRKDRERAKEVRTAAKEAFLAEQKVQEVKYAKKKAELKSEQQYKQYKARLERPSVLKRTGDFFSGIQVQPMGSATGFEQPSFTQRGGQQVGGVFDFGLFGSPAPSPSSSKPKTKKRKKSRSKKRKRRKR